MDMIFVVLVFILILLLAYLLCLFLSLRRKQYRTFLIVLLTPICIVYLAYKGFQFSWYTKVIPEQLEISYPVSAGESSSFREGCGVAVYKLSAQTRNDIGRDGLAFFVHARQARGHDDAYHHYGAWQRGALPESWRSGETPFPCSEIREGVEQEILNEIQAGEIFYAQKPEALLLVLPRLGYVVFSFYG